MAGVSQFYFRVGEDGGDDVQFQVFVVLEGDAGMSPSWDTKHGDHASDSQSPDRGGSHFFIICSLYLYIYYIISHMRHVRSIILECGATRELGAHRRARRELSVMGQQPIRIHSHSPNSPISQPPAPPSATTQPDIRRSLFMTDLSPLCPLLSCWTTEHLPLLSFP